MVEAAMTGSRRCAVSSRHAELVIEGMGLYSGLGHFLKFNVQVIQNLKRDQSADSIAAERLAYGLLRRIPSVQIGC